MDKLLKFSLILIITSSFALRLYQGSDFFFWNIDEDRFALTAKRIVVDHRPVLIGFALPAGEIYVGPIFPYILSIWYMFVAMNPFGLPFLSAFFGAFTTYLTYKVGSEIFESKRVGIFSAVFYAFSFLANVYSRVLTELTIVPILSLLVYFFLYQNIKGKKPVNLIWLGVVLLIASQNEGSSFSLIVLAVLTFFIYKFRVPAKKLVTVISLFLLANLPVLIFELRHNFFITQSFINFFFKKTHSTGLSLSFEGIKSLTVIPNAFSRFLFVNGPASIADQILPCSDLMALRNKVFPFLFLISLVLILFFAWKILKNQKAFGGRIILLHLAILLVGMTVYSLFVPGWFFEWILVIFFPSFSLIVAYFLNFLWTRNLKYLVIALLVTFAIYNLSFLFKTREDFGLKQKSEAVMTAISLVDNRPFFLDSIGSCYAQGYVFLFWHFGDFPDRSYMDPLFTPGLYQTKSEAAPEVGIVMVSPSEIESEEFSKKYNDYKNKVLESRQVGKIEVLLVKLKE